jgi:hypothetical protein
MVSVGAFCILLLVLTTVIHYEILRMLSIGLPALNMAARAKLIVVIIGAFFAHAMEIFLYAIAFYVLARYLAAGTLGDAGRSSLTLALYFSAETYTSLGYGDVVPGGDLRLLAGMEALNGLLLIGWSASYTYIAMERFWVKDEATSQARRRGAAGCSSLTRRRWHCQ